MTSASPPPAAPAEPARPFARLSVNATAQAALQRLVDDAERLGVAVGTHPTGARIVDAGIAAPGSVAAGLQVARLCLAGLAEVTTTAAVDPRWPVAVHVRSAQPVLACMASQYAGWSLAFSKQETGGKSFSALGSGPVRALARKEPLFEELGYVDTPAAGHAALVLEVDRVPPDVLVHKVATTCGLPPDRLAFVLTPTTSRAGTTQVAARVLEVALHKAHSLGFPLHAIVEGSGTAPLPQPAKEFVAAMGRTNDAILFAGQVHLMVDADDDAAAQLARQLPSSNAAQYGRPFAEVFQEVGFDFYKIDPALFAPAEVWVTATRSGRTFHAGRVDVDALMRQWLTDA